jgi:hypothetical protein
VDVVHAATCTRINGLLIPFADEGDSSTRNDTSRAPSETSPTGRFYPGGDAASYRRDRAYLCARSQTRDARLWLPHLAIIGTRVLRIRRPLAASSSGVPGC